MPMRQQFSSRRTLVSAALVTCAFSPFADAATFRKSILLDAYKDFHQYPPGPLLTLSLLCQSECQRFWAAPVEVSGRAIYMRLCHNSAPGNKLGRHLGRKRQR